MTTQSPQYSNARYPSRILDIRALSKHYDGVPAVDGVDLHVDESEIVGLVGENGAGKSTIMNVLSGVVGQWSGKVFLHDLAIAPKNYHEAVRLGIGRVYQESSLVPTLPVYENMFLSHEHRFRRMGVFLNRARMIAVAKRMLAHFQLDLDVRRDAGSFDLSTRQFIEIAKACLLTEMLSTKRPVILLDEPTSSLTREEIEILFARLRMQRAKASFLFVSHRLSEVLDISDRIYVLKDGKIVAELKANESDESNLHELMVGRRRDRDYYREGQQNDSNHAPALEAIGLGVTRQFENVTLSIRSGEILGIGGVLGSGKEKLGRVLAGIERWDKGELKRGEERLTVRQYRRVARQIVGYVPRERDAEGIMLSLSVSWNLSLASLGRLGGALPCLLNLRKERKLVDRFVRQLGIRMVSPRVPAYQLSGGNQQKVVMAKWLARQPDLLVLDNPTRGMDAGAKEEIYDLLRRLTSQGLAVVLITDELLELIGMSSRILIMKDGHITAEVAAPVDSKPAERELVACMV